MLSDKHRCLALNRALVDSAAVWAKNNIKTLIEQGNWKSIKDQLIERFGPADIELHQRDKLSRMKYDPEKSTLTSYVELYVATYDKAFTDYNTNESIKSLRMNLPNNIIRRLNYLDDKWGKYENLEDLFSLIKRFETHIEPYEIEEASKQLDKEAISSMLEDFRKTLVKDMKHDQDTLKESLAIMSYDIPMKSRNNEHIQSQWSVDAIRPYRQPYQRRPNYGKSHDNQYRFQHGRQFNSHQYNNYPKGLHNSTEKLLPIKAGKDFKKERDDKENHVKINQYYRIHGFPPGPCVHCQGNHFNLHCPLIMDMKDLK